MSFISRLGLWPQTGTNSTGLIVASTAIATAAVLSLLRSYLWPTPPKIDRSPLRTVLPTLSPDELNRLEYKPDSFPGARDYGSIRVYEWGPLTGEKVVFVHGISTSCMTLSKLAHALVNEKGCRVMLFDLFGRGFSDNPSDLPHDARLYTTQILIALASSTEISWTGPNAFKLVGYSLGGGIAVHFATAFPHLVSSLVLLAPAGLIRPESFGALSRAVFTSGLVPPRLLAWITRQRLKKPIRESGKRSNGGGSRTPASRPDPVAASLSETAPLLGGPGGGGSRPEPRNALEQRVLRDVHWQLAHHAGFVPAFMSCIRHAPLVGQHAAWAKLADRAPGTTVIILGEGDEIIDPVEYVHDARPLVGGPEKVAWAVVPGGHDFPMTSAEDTLAEMYKAWGWPLF
ncbi:672bb006-0cec-4fc7-86a6-8ad55cf07d01 [Thermothielavioides terrestris]|uniref:672bb006-0cec-4fc7-86a6-8ad55cf07d01 n=1 Tax=Thermothielavioides terrestris TaxID=2587410 RepID=A0A3S4AI03_9PEZI|nr:672bb006-0cec-4fc7-86a6-8ad55cf07d01 [Thermothielavioides terrestris]